MFNGKTYYGEEGYLSLMADVLENGSDVPDRTGVGSRAMFDAKIIFEEGVFPFSTVRPAGLRLAFHEFWSMMLQGIVQTKVLEDLGIYFWKGNTTREFLDQRGLTDVEEGSMHMGYGWQWRGFNRGLIKEAEDIVDQLKETIETLQSDIYSRRVYTTLWNPSASKYMALTPCWHSHQFVALPNEKGEPVLHLKLVNRSLDCLFGFSYASQQYRLLQLSLSKLLGVRCGTMSCDLTQVHLYKSQFEYTREVLTRDLGKQGTVTITKDINTMEDLLALQWDDIKVDGLVVNTSEFKTPRPPMAV